jgi:hypothetical protein
MDKTDLLITTATTLDPNEEYGISNEPSRFFITRERTAHQNSERLHVDIRKVCIESSPAPLNPHVRWIANNNRPLNHNEEVEALPRINALLQVAGFAPAQDMEDLAIFWGEGVRAVVSSSPHHPPLIFLFWKGRSGCLCCTWEAEGEVVECGEWLGKP